MDLSPKQYLIIYALIVTPILLSFFFRKKDRPAQLRLDDPGAQPPKGPALEGSKKPTARGPSKPSAAAQNPPYGTRTEYRRREPQARTPAPSPVAEKSLNVLFNWNGHSWDAYEVLGLPAGSSKESVNAAYQKLLVQGDKDSLPFFKAAFEAIQKS